MENDFQSFPSKQAQEVIFSGKILEVSHPTLPFNNKIVYKPLS